MRLRTGVVRSGPEEITLGTFMVTVIFRYFGSRECLVYRHLLAICQGKVLFCDYPPVVPCLRHRIHAADASLLRDWAVCVWYTWASFEKLLRWSICKGGFGCWSRPTDWFRPADTLYQCLWCDTVHLACITGGWPSRCADYATGWTTEEPWFESRQGRVIPSFQKCPDQL